VKAVECGGLANRFLNMYYTYILLSLKDNGNYFGHCALLEARLKQHNRGGVKSTRNRVPFIIHYYEQFHTRSEAFKREMFFKSFEGRKWLINNKVIFPR
jgi:putative endonuclease